MGLQPWSAVDERTIEWRVTQDESGMPGFAHCSTTVVRLGNAGCANGVAYWATELKGKTLFIAFDWIEVRQGVPILTDPNAIVTNLRLVDQEGAPISELGHVAQITKMVHHLTWQENAADAARQYRLDTGASKLILTPKLSSVHGHNSALPAGELRTNELRKAA